MIKRINNIWEFLNELTARILRYLGKHKWQARILTLALSISCIVCSLAALIIIIYEFLIK